MKRGCGVGRVGLALLAVAVMMVWTTGCQSPPHNEGFSPLADYEAVTAPGVSLPPGFYPLVGHYSQDDENDHYDGWPRYIVSERDDMIMAYVPSQTLVMGGGAGPDEVPARTVVVPHFYIDLHEVSNAQFHRFYKLAASNVCDLSWQPGRPLDCADPDYHGATGTPWAVSAAYARYWRPNHSNHHPARNVSWWEAQSYCRWAGKSLPSEAQWEAAARGDDCRLYPWGNEERTDVTRYLANAQGGRENFDGYEYTAPVQSFAGGVSPFGAYQMAGNVAEWCADWYDPSRYAFPSMEDPPTPIRGPKGFGDGQYPNPLDKNVREARVGPLRGDQKVIRGGSFADPIQKCRVDARSSAAPDSQLYNVGFRCVLYLPIDTAE
ncbi:MAG: formylglycine-generating enzyme family protein [Phycisphaerae bacterium]|nr:formylglycine-generating enzyme family protein [Phycisphaerae bacterium]